MKDHERVGQSFQNQQPQNQELAAELEEQEKDAEELANLVQTKSEAIKTLQTKLVDAKRTIAEQNNCTTKQLYIKTKIAENRNNSWKLWNLSKCLSNDNKSAEHGLNNLVGNEKNIKKRLWLFIVVNNNKS